MSEKRRVVRMPLDVSPDRDEWCDGCMTSSLTVCDVVHLTDQGVSILATVRKCWRCNPNPTED